MHCRHYSRACFNAALDADAEQHCPEVAWTLLHSSIRALTALRSAPGAPLAGDVAAAAVRDSAKRVSLAKKLQSRAPCTHGGAHDVLVQALLLTGAALRSGQVCIPTSDLQAPAPLGTDMWAGRLL